MSLLKIPVGSEDHLQGEADAPCMLVEYGDYECPHCRAAHTLVQALQARFGARLCFVYRNFPLTRIHPHAQSAAEVAEFAASHGKFWEMHDLLFENQSRLGVALFAELAGKLGLQWPDIEGALASNTFTHRINGEFSGGVRSGVNGTPTFFIHNQRFDGAKDEPSLAEAIEMAIAAS